MDYIFWGTALLIAVVGGLIGAIVVARAIGKGLD